MRVEGLRIMGPWHLANLAVEKAGGVKFALVHFDGGGPQNTALLGVHIHSGTAVHDQGVGR